jgi:hypothetical protein
MFGSSSTTRTRWAGDSLVMRATVDPESCSRLGET